MVSGVSGVDFSLESIESPLVVASVVEEQILRIALQFWVIDCGLVEGPAS